MSMWLQARTATAGFARVYATVHDAVLYTRLYTRLHSRLFESEWFVPGRGSCPLTTLQLFHPANSMMFHIVCLCVRLPATVRLRSAFCRSRQVAQERLSPPVFLSDTDTAAERGVKLSVGVPRMRMSAVWTGRVHQEQRVS